MKGEGNMENKLRGNHDRACIPREELPDEVKRLYEGIAWHLQGADVLSNLDIDLIEMTAYAIYRMRQARASLDKEGLLIQQGEKLVKNPAANIEKDYQKIFWQGCFQLGLSPVSRAKLHQ